MSRPSPNSRVWPATADAEADGYQSVPVRVMHYRGEVTNQEVLRPFMKKAMFLFLVIAVVAFGGTAMAQDILGGHNVNGHGCSSCHAPHNGAAGNGGAIADADTGNYYLWGRTFVTGSYAHLTHGSATPDSFSVSKATGLQETLFHTAACLSCHDGAIHPIGMTGTSLETVDGTNKAPTYLVTGDASNNLQNDHPVHLEYLPNPAPGTCTNPPAPAPPTCSAFNWPSTVTAGAIKWTAGVAVGTIADVNAAFAASYGNRGVRFYADTATNEAMIECSTCHNPHSMDVAKGGPTNVPVKSRFFIRGWYDSNNPGSNSATQFCRQCHYSKSNENVGRTVPTT